MKIIHSVLLTCYLVKISAKQDEFLSEEKVILEHTVYLNQVYSFLA